MSIVLQFDSTRLRSELSDLPPRLRATFAALCARRLARQSGRLEVASESQAFTELHAQLWAAVADTQIRSEDTAVAAERAQSLIPADDDDANAALTYALQAASGGDPKAAAWAAERVYEAIDAFLQDQGFEVGTPAGEAAILSHPLVQAELQRQADDLVALRNLGSSDVPPATLEAFRERADAAAESIFG